MHAGNENRGKKVDFSRLHRDNFGYYNICFQKPEGNFNIQVLHRLQVYDTLAILCQIAFCVF